MKKINPFLWFDSEAEEAAKFYVSIFKNSKIGKIARYPKEAAEKIGRPPGSVMTVDFTLDRVEFVALNPESGRGSSSSLKRSRSQLTARPRRKSIISGRNFPPMADRPGGAAGSKTNSDSLGRSNPVVIGDMLADPDKAKAARVMNALMEMDKIDIAALEKVARMKVEG